MIAPWLKSSARKRQQEQYMALSKRRAWVSQHLAEDPLFQVLSFDFLSWICPFTGRIISAPISWQEEATTHLMNIKAWTRTSILSLTHLHGLRWVLHLQEEMREDRRLRYFKSDGWWINPATGTVSDTVRREDNNITIEVVRAMAAELAELGASPHNLKSIAELLEANPPEPKRPNQPETRVHTPSEPRLKTVKESWLTDIPDPRAARIAVLSRPLEDVGGDLCVFENLPDGRSLIVVADASGHGPEAAAISSIAGRLIAEASRDFSDLASLMGSVNDGLAAELRPGQFLTCFAAVYDPEDASLRSCCAGHHHSILANARETVVMRRIGHHGMALGIRAGNLFAKTVKIDITTLEPGDTLFCYTDGLCESTNEAGVELGHWGAISAFIGHIERAPNRIIGRMLAQLRAYNGGNFDDDLTMMVFRYVGPDADQEFIQGN